MRDHTACLVTGGAGFVGSHVAERLLTLGHAVRVVDNLSTGRRENIAHLREAVEFIHGDLRDTDVCEAAVRDIECRCGNAVCKRVRVAVCEADQAADFYVSARRTDAHAII